MLFAVTVTASNYEAMKVEYRLARVKHRKLERHYKAEQSRKRDENLNFKSGNIFKRIRGSKNKNVSNVQKLRVIILLFISL